MNRFKKTALALLILLPAGAWAGSSIIGGNSACPSDCGDCPCNSPCDSDCPCD